VVVGGDCSGGVGGQCSGGVVEKVYNSKCSELLFLTRRDNLETERDQSLFLPA